MDWLAVITLGISVGLVSGVLGLGGGIFIVPLLPLVMPNLSLREVLATSLMTIFIVVTNNTIGFHKKKVIYWPLVFGIGGFSAVFAYVAGLQTAVIDESILRQILAGLFLALGIFTFIRKVKVGDVDKIKLSRKDWMICLAWGAFGGMISGLTGIGAGMILIALLVNLTIPNKMIAPISNGVMVLTTSFGALAFMDFNNIKGWQVGLVHFDIVMLLFIGAFFSSIVGRRYQHLLDLKRRRILLGTILLCLAVKAYV